MRICIFTHTFPRFNKDIAAPFMDGVACGIASTGNDIFVLTPYSHLFKKTKRTYKLVTYKYIFPDSLHRMGYSQTMTNDMGLKPIMYLLAPFFYFFGFIALLRLVKKEKIDIISAHWILPNGFIAAFVSKVTGVPLISTLPGSDVYLAGKNILFRWMALFAAKTSTAITSNSPQLLQDLKMLGADKKKFHTIIYGVDPYKFNSHKSWKEKLGKELNIAKQDLVVMGVGRLVAKKGFRYLIKAAPLVLRQTKNITFVVIGEGDQRGDLEALAKRLDVRNHFRFPGWVDYESLVYYYNFGDIFVLPSIRDEKGNLDDQSVSVVEAMACGKPVISTDFPGYRILIKDGSNGFLVPEKNSKQIANSILRLVDSNQLRKNMGQMNRKLALHKFSWPSIGRQYTKLFEHIINNEQR